MTALKLPQLLGVPATIEWVRADLGGEVVSTSIGVSIYAKDGDGVLECYIKT